MKTILALTILLTLTNWSYAADPAAVWALTAISDSTPVTLADTPLGATVKINVHGKAAKTGQAVVQNGSGTIVKQEGETYTVLTCGHIFEDLTGKFTVDVLTFVDVGGQAKPLDALAAEVVKYDTDNDLGLLTFKSSRQFPVRPIASSLARYGETVASSGCSLGKAPTLNTVQVPKRFANHLRGQHYSLLTNELPIEGRSGGGLFNKAGELVGVCWGHGKPDNDRHGYYVSLPAIRAFIQSDCPDGRCNRVAEKLSK